MRRADCRQLDGILLLDKPLGLSSNQALQTVRRLFQARKAGHTGSLDPLATGMLPICFGQATKLSGLLLDSDKSYVARAKLGERTSTGDAEGEVVERSDPSELERSELERAIVKLTGRIEQVPPMYSALKHEGQRLYQLARRGEQVERAARSLTIHSFELLAMTGDEIEVSVRCSKGTYIRTLLEDLAASVGQCANLIALHRTAVDPFEEQAMHSMESLQYIAAKGISGLDDLLLPLAEAVPNLPKVPLSAHQLTCLAQGKSVPDTQAHCADQDADLALLDPAGRLCAVGRRSADGHLKSRKWLATQ